MIMLSPSEFTTTPPEGCEFRAGDQVKYTNENGVSFEPKTIVGFTLPGDELHERCVYLDKDSYWFPVLTSELKLLKERTTK